VWAEAMNRLGSFTGRLKGRTEEEIAREAYDLRMLEQALKRIAGR